MNRTILNRTASAFAPLLLIVAAAPVHAAKDSPIDAVPDSVGVLLRMKTPQKTTKDVVALASAVDKKLGQQAQTAVLGIGAAISNPTMEGVDHSRDWWVAVFPVAKAEPRLVFFVPTEDAEKFKNSVAGQFEFADQDDWVIYAKNEAALKPIQDRLGGKGKSVSTLLEGDAKAVWDRGDLSLFVNMAPILETYKPELEQAKERVKEQIQELKNFAPATPGMQMEPIFEMYQGLAVGFFQALEDTELVTTAVMVAESGLEIEKFSTVRPDTPTAKFLKRNPASPLAMLGRLPEQQLAYFGFSGDMQAVTKWGLALTVSMLDNDPDLVKAVKTITAEYEKFEFGPMVGSLTLGPLEGGAVRGATISEISPASGLRELTAKMPDVMAKISNANLNTKVEYKPDAETYGDRKADVTIVEQTVDPNNDPLGFQKEINDAMFGKDGMTTRTVYLKDRVIQTVGGGKEAMKNLLDAVDADSADVGKAAAATRKKLNDTANILVLVDLPGIAGNALRLVAESGKVPDLPISADQIKDLELTPSYLGYGIGTEKSASRVRLYIPAEQGAGIAKIVRMFMDLQQQQQF